MRKHFQCGIGYELSTEETNNVQIQNVFSLKVCRMRKIIKYYHPWLETNEKKTNMEKQTWHTHIYAPHHRKLYERYNNGNVHVQCTHCRMSIALNIAIVMFEFYSSYVCFYFVVRLLFCWRFTFSFGSLFCIKNK